MCLPRLGSTKKRGALISRLRMDTRLYGFPEPVPPGRRGRKPKKGHRLPSLKQLAADPTQRWREIKVNWYGGESKLLEILDGFCLWHTPGQDPLPVRWVVARDPEQPDARAEAFFSTASDLTPWQILGWFVMRWSVEVTFSESRRHLGVETQRQWSDKAIARTTPTLLGLFSIASLIAVKVMKETNETLIRTSAWYPKQEATFSDVLACVRRVIWSHQYFVNSTPEADHVQLPNHMRDALLDQLAATA